MNDNLPVSLRTQKGELRYQLAKKAGKTIPLEDVKALSRWRYWKLIPNDFPYDMIFDEHHMLIPKRIFPRRIDMAPQEYGELVSILMELDDLYDVFFENTTSKASVPYIFHIHLGSYYKSRDKMKRG